MEIEKSEEICLSACAFKGAVAYWAYAQSPKREPRSIEKVMKALEGIIQADFKVIMGDFQCKSFQDEEALYKYINEKLLGIPEIEDWNLSYNEKKDNIDVNDPNRGGYRLISAYDKRDIDSWKDDFVDLDAFIGNVMTLIMKGKCSNDYDLREKQLERQNAGELRA